MKTRLRNENHKKEDERKKKDNYGEDKKKMPSVRLCDCA